ncbi:nuclear transport factor 2 family protein [Plantibacter sp. YIM 135249]|uniref:nuclear transport factor 2 family protein n=1 Tax=Plantibacter sp. YIM 135249 TaxID=3423918 RepID=UPI003D32C4B5
MTTLDLSPTITAYFERMDHPAKAGIAELFTPDALVIDDGNAYRGTDAIQGWLRGAASEYTVTSTVLAVERSGGGDPRTEPGSAAVTVTVVDVLLEGDFPGGRVELRHRFREEPTGLISTLTIGVE